MCCFAKALHWEALSYTYCIYIWMRKKNTWRINPDDLIESLLEMFTFLSLRLRVKNTHPLCASQVVPHTHTEKTHAQRGGSKAVAEENWQLLHGRRLLIQAALAGRARNEAVERSSVIRIWFPHHHWARLSMYICVRLCLKQMHGKHVFFKCMSTNIISNKHTMQRHVFGQQTAGPHSLACANTSSLYVGLWACVYHWSVQRMTPSQ